MPGAAGRQHAAVPDGEDLYRDRVAAIHPKVISFANLFPAFGHREDLGDLIELAEHAGAARGHRAGWLVCAAS